MEVASDTKHPIPVRVVMLVQFFAFMASFVVTSLRNFGGFNYAGHPTSLANAITETLGAVFLLPLLHLMIASFWRSKRNPLARRKIFFWWAIAVCAMQTLQIGYMSINGMRLEGSHETSRRATATIADWNRELSGVMKVLSTERIAPGEEMSLACVNDASKSSCLQIQMLRRPFDRERLIIPVGRAKPNERGEKPVVFPYLHLEDGATPRIMLATYSPRGTASEPISEFPGEFSVLGPWIGIVVGGDLAYETTRNDISAAFSPTEEERKVLRTSRSGAPMAIRLRFARPNDILSDDVFDLGTEDSRQFASELEAMFRAEELLNEALSGIEIEPKEP